MPTNYFNITNKYVMKLVDDKNFVLLNEYLSNNFDVLANYEKLNLYPISTKGCLIGPWIGLSDEFDEKMYDIMSYAIPTANLDVVKYYKNKINPNMRADGNAFSYLELAESIKNNNIGKQIYHLLLSKK